MRSLAIILLVVGVGALPAQRATGSVTAVVTGILVVQGRSSGKPFLHRYRFTDTWVKNPSGDWQIVAAQDYLMPAKG